MGHKIFISYKYHDSNVKKVTNKHYGEDTARDYVNLIAKYLNDKSDHIYKGESDGEDLSQLSDDSIWSTLKDRIYDSSLTLVLVSPGMKDNTSEKNQWIPWEISYSLKEVSRKNKAGNMVTSFSNAIIAVILPDRNGSYSYYLTKKSCCSSGCRSLNTDFLFDIMKKNMFNIKKPDKHTCDNKSVVYLGDSSYITSVIWDDFAANPESYIATAYKIQNSIEQYNMTYDLE